MRRLRIAQSIQVRLNTCGCIRELCSGHPVRCGIVGNHCLTQAHTVAGRIMTRTTRRAATNLTVLPNHTRCCTRHTQCSDACSRKYPNDVASRCCTRHTQYTYTCSRKCPKDMASSRIKRNHEMETEATEARSVSRLQR